MCIFPVRIVHTYTLSVWTVIIIKKVGEKLKINETSVEQGKCDKKLWEKEWKLLKKKNRNRNTLKPQHNVEREIKY